VPVTDGHGVGVREAVAEGGRGRVGTAPVASGRGKDGALLLVGTERGSRGRSPGQFGSPGTRAVRTSGIVAVGVTFARLVGGAVAVARPPQAPSSMAASAPHRTMARPLPGMTCATFK
jgi:hypothetical protein